MNNVRTRMERLLLVDDEVELCEILTESGRLLTLTMASMGNASERA
jgi:hypothetical protein